MARIVIIDCFDDRPVLPSAYLVFKERLLCTVYSNPASLSII